MYHRGRCLPATASGKKCWWQSKGRGGPGGWLHAWWRQGAAAVPCGAAAEAVVVAGAAWVRWRGAAQGAAAAAEGAQLLLLRRHRWLGAARAASGRGGARARSQFLPPLPSTLPFPPPPVPHSHPSPTPTPPPVQVLVLDEATSALDSKSERVVQVGGWGLGPGEPPVPQMGMPQVCVLEALTTGCWALRSQRARGSAGAGCSASEPGPRGARCDTALCRQLVCVCFGACWGAPPPPLGRWLGVNPRPACVPCNSAQLCPAQPCSGPRAQHLRWVCAAAEAAAAAACCPPPPAPPAAGSARWGGRRPHHSVHRPPPLYHRQQRSNCSGQQGGGPAGGAVIKKVGGE